VAEPAAGKATPLPAGMASEPAPAAAADSRRAVESAPGASAGIAGPGVRPEAAAAAVAAAAPAPPARADAAVGPAAAALPLPAAVPPAAGSPAVAAPVAAAAAAPSAAAPAIAGAAQGVAQQGGVGQHGGAQPQPQARRAFVTPANAAPWVGDYVRAALSGLDLHALRAALGWRMPPSGAPARLTLTIDRDGYVRAAEVDGTAAAPQAREIARRHFGRHSRTLPFPPPLAHDLDELVVPVAL
jgi:hypothetical protein